MRNFSHLGNSSKINASFRKVKMVIAHRFANEKPLNRDSDRVT